MPPDGGEVRRAPGAPCMLACPVLSPLGPRACAGVSGLGWSRVLLSRLVQTWALGRVAWSKSETSPHAGRQDARPRLTVPEADAFQSDAGQCDPGHFAPSGLPSCRPPRPSAASASEVGHAQHCHTCLHACTFSQPSSPPAGLVVTALGFLRASVTSQPSTAFVIATCMCAHDVHVMHRYETSPYCFITMVFPNKCCGACT